MKSLYLVFGFLTLLIFSCQKAIETQCENSPFTVLENADFEKNEKPKLYQDAIFIMNEGGFTYGNSSISAYFPSTKVLENNVFKTVNNFSLGDVVQSIYKKGDFTYIVINNSQKIEVVKTNTFERLRTIIGFASPRYLQFMGSEKVLVTDLYENKINYLDLESGCSLGSIATKGWTEEIEKINGKYWAIERSSIGVLNKYANLIEIDVEHLSIKQRIAIPAEPNSLTVDKNGNIWILASGLEDKNIFPSLTKFNTSTASVESTFSFSDFINTAQNIAYNPQIDKLYFSKGNKIFDMSSTDIALPSQPYFTSAAQLIYNISINPNTQEIYLSDAVDYVSNGKVYRYSPSGNLLHEFEVGNLPSKIIF